MTEILFIFLTRKTSLFFIALMAISFLLFIPSSSAELSFTSPEQAEINEEFTISISADYSDISDVKAFIHTSEDAKINSNEIISLIYYENQWRNPLYYLNSTFPEIKDYKIKATKSQGNWQICIRLRKITSTSYKQECKPIKVIEQAYTPSNSSLGSSNTTQKSKSTQTKNITAETISEETEEQEVIPAQANSIPKDNPQEPIILNQQKTESKSFTTSLGKKEFYIFGSFIVLCIIIIILFALKKL